MDYTKADRELEFQRLTKLKEILKPVFESAIKEALRDKEILTLLKETIQDLPYDKAVDYIVTGYHFERFVSDYSDQLYYAAWDTKAEEEGAFGP